MQDQSGTNPDAIDKAEQAAESQVDRIIDEFAGKVPGGQNATPEAKNAAHNIFERIEEEADKHLPGQHS